MNKILKIVNLKKNFGAITASNDINFCLETGEIHALIGPCLLYTSPSPRD